MIPFPIPWKLVGIAAILALIGYLLWREHYLSHKLTAARVELSQANANYAALQAAQAHERKISEDASHDFERRLTEIAKDRAAIPVRSVRMCNSNRRDVSATTITASGTHAGSAEPVPPTTGSDPSDGRVYDRFSDDGPDVGPFLYQLADEADRAVAQCAALQGWVKSR